MYFFGTLKTIFCNLSEIAMDPTMDRNCATRENVRKKIILAGLQYQHTSFSPIKCCLTDSIPKSITLYNRPNFIYFLIQQK